MNTLDALKIASEAMKERRAYCEQWEYKYGKEWDNEDGYIQDAIDKLEGETAENKVETEITKTCSNCGNSDCREDVYGDYCDGEEWFPTSR